MSEKYRYKLDIGVSDDADVEEIEDSLRDILLDLYDEGDVESIRVTKTGRTGVKEIPGLVEIIDRLRSEDIKGAIDVVNRMEDTDDDE